MGLFAGSAARRQNVAFSEPFWPELGIGLMSKAGQIVTADKAMQVMAVLSCLRVVSEDVAQVTRGLFKKGDNGGRDEAKDHALSKIFLRRPNPWQTGFEFIEMMVIHTMLAGRFIAFKNVVRGEVRELIPFEPGCVTIFREDSGALTYTVTPTDKGEAKVFPASAIWHVKGPSWNGWDGMEIMKLARQAIGLTMATEESHALMHANGGQASGFYSVDAVLKEEQFKTMRDWIARSIQGVNKFKPFILDRSGKWNQTGMKGVDSEHIATRKFQIEEVCRAFRVMPIMIGFSDKTATYASSEQMFDAHVKYTLGGWFRRIEESINTNLLSDAEWQSGLYFKFLPISLLRGTAKDRGEFYYRLWQMGAMNPNQIRAREDENPYEGGDTYRVPLNMGSAEDTPNHDDPLQDPTAPGKPGARLNVGRVLSGKNEGRIRDADGLLNDVLAELDADGASARAEQRVDAPPPNTVTAKEMLSAMQDLATRTIHLHLDQQQSPITLNVPAPAGSVVHNHFPAPADVVVNNNLPASENHVHVPESEFVVNNHMPPLEVLQAPVVNNHVAAAKAEVTVIHAEPKKAGQQDRPYPTQTVIKMRDADGRADVIETRPLDE